jgi:hypothetical protein
MGEKLGSTPSRIRHHRREMRKETDLREFLPEGVLRDYVNLWTPTTDAPSIYHVAGALGVVATLLANRVYLPYAEWCARQSPSRRHQPTRAGGGIPCI